MRRSGFAWLPVPPRAIVSPRAQARTWVAGTRAWELGDPGEQRRRSVSRFARAAAVVALPCPAYPPAAMRGPISPVQRVEQRDRGLPQRRCVWVLALLLVPQLCLADPPSRWVPVPLPKQATPAEGPAPLPETAEPPAWIQWLGWSEDGRRIAWREGSASEPRRPGQPIEIARLDAQGGILDRVHVTTEVLPSLHARRIRVQPPVQTDQATPGDVVLQTARGSLLAVAVRGEPAVAAVLRKHSGKYEPIARWDVRSPATHVTAQGFEDDAHRLLAIVATTGQGKSAQAHLILVPLTDLPQSRTPTSP
jgi:hypothetical protein